MKNKKVLIVFLAIYLLCGFKTSQSNTDKKIYLLQNKKKEVYVNCIDNSCKILINKDVLKSFISYAEILLNSKYISGSGDFFKKFYFLRCPDVDIDSSYTESKFRNILQSVKINLGYRYAQEDLMLYQNYLYAGVSINLLKNGIYENYLKEDIKNLKMRFMKRTDKNFYCKLLFLDDYFSNILHSIEKKRLKINSDLLNVTRISYFLGLTLPERGIVLLNKINLLKDRIKRYKSTDYLYNKEKNLGFFLYFIDRNTFNRNYLYKIREEEKLRDRILLSEEEPLSKISLSFFINYSLKGRDTLLEKKGLIGGIRLGIPLDIFDNTPRLMNYKSYDDIYNANYLYTQLNEEFYNLIQQIRNLEIKRENLRVAVINAKFDMEKNYILYENFFELMKKLDEFLEQKEKIVMLFKNYYTKLYRFMLKTGIDFYDLKKIDHPVREYYFGRLRNGNRIVYIWSGALKKFDGDYIIDFLLSKKISHVFLSYELFTKNIGFVKKLSENLFHISIVLSNPKYIFPDRWQEVKDKINKILQQDFSLHLDIEPHMLKGFSSQKDLYLKMYTRFLRKVDEVMEKEGKVFSYTVSPAYYEVLEKFRPEHGKVVLMLYGISDPSIFLKKYGRLFEDLNKKEVIVALRAKDFKNEYFLEKLIDTIISELKIDTFAIHNLIQYVELSLKGKSYQ